MANRSFMPPAGSMVKRKVELFARFLVGEAGAVTLRKWNYPTLGTGTAARTYTAAPTASASLGYPNNYNAGAEGVFSVTRTAAGLWTVKLQDNYQRLVGLSGYQSIAGGTANIVAFAENTTISNMDASNGSVIGVALLSATATAADPTADSSISLTFILADATEP